MKFADIGSALKVVNNNPNPLWSGCGKLPYLVDEGKKYCGYDQIVNHLEKAGFSLKNSDPSLSYLRENLYPCFMYQLWGSPQNVDDTRSLYAKRTPFPFNFYYPGTYIRKTNEITQTVAGFSLEDPLDSHETTEMLAKAKKCLNWISEKLSTNEFFIEGMPSSVDATLYAYLAVIIRYQLPNNQLQSHATQCENLVRYVNNITKKYFKESEVFESPQAKAKSAKKEQKVFTGMEEEDPPNVVRNRYLVSGLFAATAMMSFALLTGIFSVKDLSYFY